MKKLLASFILISISACGSSRLPSDDVLPPRDDQIVSEDGFDWEVSRALSEGRVGEWSKLRLDASGSPFVGHVAVANPYEIHLTQEAGSGWSDMQVGSSGRVSSVGLGFWSNHPIVGFFDGTDLQLYNQGTTQTLDTTGETGDWPSLAVSTSGTAMVAFQRCFYDRDLCNDTTSRIRSELRLARSSDLTNWSVETVEEGSITSNSGFYTDLQIRNGQPVMAFFNRAAGAIRVAIHEGSAFDVPENWNISEIAQLTGGDSIPSLSVSPSGVLGVSYYDPAGEDLYYAESSDGGATWGDPELVDRMGNVGSYSSLAFDPDGSPVVAYYDATDRGEGEGLKVAWKADSLWVTRSLIRGDRMGQFPSLARGTDHAFVVSYFDGLEGDLMFSSFVGEVWPHESQL